MRNSATGRVLGLSRKGVANLLRFSDIFTNATYWLVSGSQTLTANTVDVADPWGGSRATKCVVASGAPNFSNLTTGAINLAMLHTISIYARTASGTVRFGMGLNDSTATVFRCPLTNTFDATTTWQRFSVVGTTNCVPGNVTRMHVYPAQSTGASGAVTIYFASAMLNIGNSAATYRSTT